MCCRVFVDPILTTGPSIPLHRLPSQALAVDKDRLLFECIGALKHLDAQNRELHARLRRLEDEKN
eukprot:m.869122 g.869122  ORF g.869122 m.869122 type:complete len:65 (-) comp23563_c2_seq57:936-1130(-)